MKTLITPSQKVIAIIVVFFISTYLISLNSHPFLGCKSETVISKKDSLVSWKYPELSTIPDTEDGKITKLGLKIFTETYSVIGPNVEDPTKRYSGNNMDCQNCHLRAGTLKNVFGLVGSYTAYPELDPRSDKVITIQQRINQCMMRSLNGKPLPETGSEMNALVSYLKWLSTDVPKGKYTEGRGVPKIELISRAANPDNGKLVYLRNCTTCHSESGRGVLNKPGNVSVPADSSKGYNYPPVMGLQSYNTGAGMYRLLTVASFIYTKMPYNDAVLTLDEAYDAAAYINTEPRPEMAGLESDYPNLKLKPIDAAFPPYPDTFSQKQHKYGPYQPMLKEGETSKLIDPNISR